MTAEDAAWEEAEMQLWSDDDDMERIEAAFRSGYRWAVTEGAK